MRLPRNAGLFIVLAAFWGWSFVAIEVGLEYYSPLLFAAYRFDLAALVLFGIVLIRERPVRPSTRDDVGGIFLSGVLTVAISNAFLFVGQQFTTSGISSIMFSLVPIVTGAIAAVWIGETGLDRRGLLGLFGAFVGVGLVAQPDPANLEAGMATGVGVIFLGVVAVSVASVGLNQLELSISNLVMTAWAMLVGGGLLHALSLVFGEAQQLPEPELEPLLALLFLGLCASAIGYAVFFELLERVGAIQVNLVSYAIPVVATITGAILLAEPITLFTIAGFGLILLGFVLLKRHALRRIVATSQMLGR